MAMTMTAAIFFHLHPFTRRVEWDTMARQRPFRPYRWFRRRILVGSVSALVVVCLLIKPNQTNQRELPLPSPPQVSQPLPIDTVPKVEGNHLPVATRIDSVSESKISSSVNRSLMRVTNETVSTEFKKSPHIDPATVRLKSNRTLFVHVGKTGGETIKSVLRAGCEAMLNEKRRRNCLHTLPNSKLSDSVQTYLHCFTIRPSQRKRSFQQHDAFLYSVRHPVDRAISWYQYVSPHSCRPGQSQISPRCQAARLLHTDPTSLVAQFFTCFATVHDWAAALTLDQSNGLLPRVVNETNIDTTDCRTLARSIASGRENAKTAPTMAHMVANYQYYMQQTILKQPLSHTPILVVRTTHLWQDLQTIDRLLNGTGDFGILHGSAFTHNSEQYNGNHTMMTTPKVSTSDTTATAALVQGLCCALHSELLLYRTLIESAINLLEPEKQITLQATVERCGWDSWSIMATTCSSATA